MKTSKEKIISGLTEEIVDRLSQRHAVRLVDHEDPNLTSRMARISTYFFNPEELKIDGLLCQRLAIWLAVLIAKPSKIL